MQAPQDFDPNLKCHTLALQFPDLDPVQYEALRDDLRTHGLRHPIVVDRQGRIIDGRHRYRALLDLYREYQEKFQGADLAVAVRKLGFSTRRVEPGTEAEFALSSNLARRHLSPSQRCMIVAKSQLYDPGGRRKQGINVSDLARRYGLQRVTLYKAEYVLRHCKDAAAKVRDPQRKQELLGLPQLVIEGKRSVGLAEEQIAQILGPKKLKEPIEELKELSHKLVGQIRRVSNNEQTLSKIAPLLRKLARSLSDAEQTTPGENDTAHDKLRSQNRKTRPRDRG
jgi:hypothetical protein